MLHNDGGLLYISGGIRASYGADTTQRNQAHRGHSSGGEEGGGGLTDLRPGINQYPACSDKSSRLQ